FSSLGSVTVAASNTLNFNSGLSLPSRGPVTVGSNGRPVANFSTGSAVTMASLTVTGASAGTTTLTGSDNLTVTGATTWSNFGSSTPTISGSGLLILHGGLSMPGPGTSIKLVSRTLENFGTASFDSNGIILQMTSATIINEPGATWN